MIAKFPRMSSAELVKILHVHGFEDVRQKGSHLILSQASTGKHVTVPIGRKDLPIGTAKSICRAAGISTSDIH